MPSSFRPLSRSFFLQSPAQVAPALIGKLLVRRHGSSQRCVRIVETEAYLGEDDSAAHAAAGLTPRTAVLFGDAGRAYIYLIYGIHLCLNVSTLPRGEAGGVLFRAADGGNTSDLSGPGRLTRGLGITAALNGGDLTRPGPLFLADDGCLPPAIAVSTRVGIRKAVRLPLRFFWDGHPAVSRPHGPVLSRLHPIASGAGARVYSGLTAHGH